MCIIIFGSCQRHNSVDTKSESVEKRDFKGFGELIIGDRFDSISSFKQFKKTEKNSYYADAYEISKEIGVVENVTIMLKYGKINGVNFDNSSISNKNKIDSCFRSYKSKVEPLPSSGKDWRVYKSIDDRVRLTMTIIGCDYLYHKLGYYPTNYFYYDLSDEDENDYGI